MNFLKKLWLGEFPLWKTYWLYFVLPNIVAIFVDAMLCEITEPSDLMMLFSLIFLVVYTCYYFIALGGLWRSADNYKGNRVWKFFAKLIVIAAVIDFVLAIYDIIFTA